MGVAAVCVSRREYLVATFTGFGTSVLATDLTRPAALGALCVAPPGKPLCEPRDGETGCEVDQSDEREALRLRGTTRNSLFIRNAAQITATTAPPM